MNNTSVLNIYGDYRDIDIEYGVSSQDYFVHMLRFSKMVDLLHDKNIFDLGCGAYTNLLKALCEMRRGPAYKCYIGTDYNKVKQWRPDYKPIWDKTLILECRDFTDSADFNYIAHVLHEVFENEPFAITCFEVLEHMDFDMQNIFLYNLSTLLHDANLNVEACYFSTPNHNGSPAKNHISELSYKLEEEMFDRYGISIKQAQGLSAWKKFHVASNLDDGNPEPAYAKFMPDPLAKMIWGAALPRQFSNNILYNLTSTKSELAPFNDLRSKEYKWGEWRQGGKHQADCASLFCKE